MKPFVHALFLVTATAHVVSCLIAPAYAPSTKPALLPLLLLYYLAITAPGKRNIMVMVALLFSFLGDVLLMRNDKELFFLLGLSAFLAAHVAYILVYHSMRDPENDQMLRGIQKLRYSFPVLLAGFGLLGILVPRTGGMKVPVAAYALVLMAMVLAALFRFGRTSKRSFAFVFSGAILFMMSDALLAVNKFLEPVFLASFWIMLTYCAAQYLIVRGLMAHTEHAQK